MAHAWHYTTGKEHEDGGIAMPLPHTVHKGEEGDTYQGGCWDCPKSAPLMVGSWLYLHLHRAEPAFMGGRITGFRHIFLPHLTDTPNRVVFFFKRDPKCDGCGWRGAQGRWSSGPVEADFPHEAE